MGKNEFMHLILVVLVRGRILESGKSHSTSLRLPPVYDGPFTLQ